MFYESDIYRESRRDVVQDARRLLRGSIRANQELLGEIAEATLEVVLAAQPKTIDEATRVIKEACESNEYVRDQLSHH